MSDFAREHIVLDLIAFGPQPENRWRHRIPEGEIIRLGRAPRHGLRVAWDMMISREHVEIVVESSHLRVKCLETARNPLVYKKKPLRELTVGNGESFQIGSTTFLVEVIQPVLAQSADDSLYDQQVIEEYTFAHAAMENVKFENSDLRLEVLSKLPRIISESRDEKTLAIRLVALLLEGLPRARAAAVFKFRNAGRIDDPEVNYWDVRDGDARHFHPSRRLMQSTLSQGDSRLHILSESASNNAAVTMQENLDWAFCTPLVIAENEAWCLYASGQVFAPDVLRMEENLRGDVRFTELLAQFLSSVRQVCRLQRQQAALSQFFSPAVMETLTGGQAAVLLTPRESDITVLFCDVRGFSQAAEEAAHGLAGLLERISRALSVMTRGIVRYDGVIADFQGDAALGFWGWPVAMEDGPLPACRAALYIDSVFREAAQDLDHALANFRVGIGIAHGRAIAGNIGAVEQSKVGAFGPVVNLGSRLEGLAKRLRVPIIIDEATAEIVRKELPPTEGRSRRLVRLRPQGMRLSLLASELLPPEGPHSPLTDQNLADYGRALESFMSGDWDRAERLLADLPVEDGAACFLRDFMAEHNGRPPQDWDGTINLKSK